MENSGGKLPCREDKAEKFWRVTAPVVFGALYFVIGLFFRRQGMGDPDSYRQALSALAYLEEGAYTSYWDFPLTMHVFVVGTRLAVALGLSHLAVLNTVAVFLGAVTVWPLYQLIRRLASRQAAAFAAAAYVFSPTLIRYSTYLSHEIVGFTFAVWSVYLFERVLARGDRPTAFAFGLSFGAAFAARANGAAFIVLPLLLLSLRDRGKFKLPQIAKLLLFALLGFAGAMLIAHRPDTILRFKARLDVWFFTYYEIGRFIGRTTLTALQSLTPALVVATALGVCALIFRRRFFLALFGGVWILTVYLFYAGMDICRLKFFIVLLPPCMLLVFAAADQIDGEFHFGLGRPLHLAKVVTALLLILASLGPNLPELLYIRKANDDEMIAKGIGHKVGRELLFTTSLKPMIGYYNRDNPPETVYLVTEYSPGKITMNMDALRLAQQRLREGRPVFTTGIILNHFDYVNIDVDAELVWEYKSVRLFRLSSLKMTAGGDAGSRAG